MVGESPKAPRERLLNAANKLFYEEGIHTVGIDRVIESAGVAKASLYSTFGSKDALVRAYLTQRMNERQKRIEQSMSGHTSPRARLLAIFDGLGELIARPTFRGCAFQRASAEGPTGAAAQGVCDESRSWLRALLLELAQGAGAKDPRAPGPATGRALRRSGRCRTNGSRSEHGGGRARHGSHADRCRMRRCSSSRKAPAEVALRSTDTYRGRDHGSRAARRDDAHHLTDRCGTWRPGSRRAA
ncbi:MAG: TetR/AcrR family transcriptional regulator [Pseudomonadota bacterium]